MVTTIQVSDDLLKELKSMKRHDKESYEDIIWDLIEDRMELSEETKKNIKESEKQIAEGKTVSLEEVKRKIMSRKCTK
jgi:predicted transcriptional regulator